MRKDIYVYIRLLSRRMEKSHPKGGWPRPGRLLRLVMAYIFVFVDGNDEIRTLYTGDIPSVKIRWIYIYTCLSVYICCLCVGNHELLYYPHSFIYSLGINILLYYNFYMYTLNKLIMYVLEWFYLMRLYV